MLGSGDERRAGFGLLVPAVLLALALGAVVVAPFTLAPPVSEAVAAERVEPAEPISSITPSITPEDDDRFVEVVDLPTPEIVPTRAVVVAVSTPTPRPIPTPVPTATPTWAGPPTFTFVALGVDQRNDREIPRTDTIMIGQVDLRVPRVSLVSIPRDLLVEIPGYGKDRINSAYVYGEQFKEPGGGIGLLQRTIENSFGITIDHFGMVDFQCFRTAVDAVGGVTVNVPRAIVDPNYPTEDYGTKLVKFEPGIQVMDGERALEYARTRSADSDFHRMQRQQLIVSAMRDQLLQLRTLPAIPTVLTGCRNLRSDLGWREYLNLAGSLRALDSRAVSFAAIDETMVVDAVLPNGAAVLLPRWDAIRPMIGERFARGESDAGQGTRASASPQPLGSPYPLLSPAPATTSTLPDGPVVRTPNDVLPGDAVTPAPLVPKRT